MANTNQNAKTTMDFFTSGVADFIRLTVLEKVAEYVTSQGLQMSVDELVEQLELPCTPKNLQSPAASAFGGVPTAAPTAKGRGRREAVRVPDGHGCVYVFIRGDNQGKKCGKARADGYEYCNQCLKKSAVKAKLKGGGGASAPRVPTTGFASAPQVDEEQSNELRVQAYNEDKRLYRELVHNFIVQSVGDIDNPDIYAIGRLDGDTIVELNDKEKIIATSMDLKIPDATQNDPPSASVPKRSPVAPPASSQSPAAVGKVSAIPAVPSIHNIGTAASMPAVVKSPTIPGIPSIPAIGNTMPNVAGSVPTLN